LQIRMCHRKQILLVTSLEMIVKMAQPALLEQRVEPQVKRACSML
jgi:hypothetical protein